MKIGHQIKKLRKSQGMTLQTLSAKTGFSLGFLSHLERDLTSPTIAQLQTIADVFGVTIFKLLEEHLPFCPVVRKDSRQALHEAEGKVRYERITPPYAQMRGLCLTIHPDNYEEEISWGHNKDEYGIIVQGSILMELDGVEYELHEGDAIYIPAATPHKFHKSSPGVCVSYWTIWQGDITKEKDMQEPPKDH